MLKFSAVMIILNGMPWLPYLLRSIYPHMDEIIIIEGATEDARAIATPDGHSLDSTRAVLDAFPDPDHKIKRLDKGAGFWNNETEMARAQGEAVSGDVVWQFDVDEFYHAADILQIKSLLAAQPQLRAISLRFCNFFGGFQTISYGGRHTLHNNVYWRIFRLQTGDRYVDRLTPKVETPKGLDTRTLHTIDGNFLARQLGVQVYHYSMVFPIQAYRKVAYWEYLTQSQQYGNLIKQGVNYEQWYEDCYLRFRPWRNDFPHHPISWIEPFQAKHPEAIQNLMTDLLNGTLQLELRPTEDLDRFINSGQWRLWQTMGWTNAQLYHFFKYDGPFRQVLRPIVRPIRSRFFGYDYA